jgi:hypothetical protein
MAAEPQRAQEHRMTVQMRSSWLQEAVMGAGCFSSQVKGWYGHMEDLLGVYTARVTLPQGGARLGWEDL